MTAAYVGFINMASNKTAGTTLAVSCDTAAGNLVVLRIVFDNAATASKPVVTSIAKEAGETNDWVFLGAARSTSTSAGAFASGEVWCIRTTVAWTTGAKTITLDASVTQKVAMTEAYSGVQAVPRCTAGTAYSTTTTAASATTTGTTPQVGDLAVGLIFGSNVPTTSYAGDTDTTGGVWVGTMNFGTTGGSGSTNNAGQASYKVLTGGSHQTHNNSAAMTAGNGAVVAILQAIPSGPPPNTGSGAAADAWAVTASGKSPDKGDGVVAHAWAVMASGTKPVVAPPGSRALETNVARITEDGGPRNLESATVLPAEGTAAVSYVEALSAAGKKTPKGSTTVSYAETPTAAGKKTPKGATTVSYVEATTASGKKTPKGATTTSYVEATTASGKKAPKATVVVAYTETLSATGIKPGVPVKSGSGTTSWAATTSAVGVRAPKATGTGVHTWTMIAQGVKPSVGVSQGSGLVTWAETGGGVGKRAPKAAATVPYVETITASGKRAPKAAATVPFVETPTAAGKRVPKGARTVAYVEAVTATGKRVQKGTVLVAWVETTTASGKRVQKGSGVITDMWVLSATGLAPVTLVGFYTIAMQYGGWPVVAWELDGQGAPV